MEYTSDSSDILSVTAFTRLARTHIEQQFDDIRVEGEISNFKQHTSGHCYFTLKDSEAQVRCVMWRHVARSLYFTPQDGMLVRLYGKASLYEKRGDLQLVTTALRHAGEGGLQKAFEELKTRLLSEGLFDKQRKQTLPPIPSCIGVITSGSGAALHDILSIIERRFPLVEVLVFPVQVQGPDAAPSICEAIESFEQLVAHGEFCVDALIVGRGGGSLEDLWAFNEERVARAIHASTIPIVSAVGHETDFTIADFVADIRAATPSMAAEIVTPHWLELRSYIESLFKQSKDRLLDAIDEKRTAIQSMTNTYSFNKSVDQVSQYKIQLDALTSQLERNGSRFIQSLQERTENYKRRLDLLDPYRPLKKGYAIVEQDGRFIRSAHELASHRPASIRFDDGSRTVQVEE